MEGKDWRTERLRRFTQGLIPEVSQETFDLPYGGIGCSEEGIGGFQKNPKTPKGYGMGSKSSHDY